MADLPDYTVRVSPRAKRARITVSPAGAVEVVIPRGFPRREVPALVAARRDWLVRTLDRVQARRPEGATPTAALPEAVTLPALGQHWPVAYPGEGAGRPRVREVEGALRVHAADRPGGRDALCAWLAATAKAHLVPWVHTVAAETGLRPGRITIRAQATRWGSCSARGNLSLNRNLLFLEPAEVRYLLVHELAHTVHLDHSPAFWELVGRMESDYRRLDRGLRRATDRVPTWALPDRLLPANFFTAD